MVPPEHRESIVLNVIARSDTGISEVIFVLLVVISGASLEAQVGALKKRQGRFFLVR